MSTVHAARPAARSSTEPPDIAIPAVAELAKRPQWVLFRLENTGKPKPDKVPYQPSGRKASVDKPGTWSSFDEVVAAYLKGGFDGIGYVFAPDDPYCGCDLDDCRDANTTMLAEWAWDTIRDFDTYAEASPSGTGVHLIARGRVPEGRKVGNFELYSEGRFFTVTGHHIAGTPETIAEAFDAIEALWRRLTAEQQQRRQQRGGNGATEWDAAADVERIRVKLEALLAADDKARRSWEHDRPELPDQSLSSYDLSLASIAARHGWTDTELALLIRAHREKHGSDKWQRVDYVERTIARARLVARATAGVGGAAAAELVHLEPSDTGNADRLLVRFGHELRYATHAGWFAWDGRRWQLDERQRAVKLAQRTARLIFGECKHLTDADAQERRAKWAVALQNRAKVEGMLAMAAPHVATVPDELDAEPWLLTVANGTLDLRSGELRPHRREDFITKLCPVAYDPDAKAPTWERFLGEIVLDDEEVVRFVQRAVGYSLTGLTIEQILFLLWGGGSNGKSTLLEVLGVLLGDYGQQAPAQTFTAKERGDGIPNDVARLAGARFVATVETKRGRQLDEALVKQATGGDRMPARFLHKEWFEFQPQFKLWLATNHKPEIRGTDEAIWRRIRLIPFEEQFWRADDSRKPDGAKLVDKRLKEKLLKELPGILAWAVRGCLDWRRDGLAEPEKVLAATEDYREEMDALGGFLGGLCDRAPEYSERAKELYDAYQAWCQANGEEAWTQTRFGTALTERGFRKDKAGVVVYRGIALKDGWKELLRPKKDDQTGRAGP